MKHPTFKSRWLPLILVLATLMALLLVACTEDGSGETTPADTTVATDPVTGEPTVEPDSDETTEAPSDKVEETTVADGEETTGKPKKGCGSVIGGMAVLMMAVTGACAIAWKKKDE